MCGEGVKIPGCKNAGSITTGKHCEGVPSPADPPPPTSEREAGIGLEWTIGLKLKDKHSSNPAATLEAESRSPYLRILLVISGFTLPTMVSGGSSGHMCEPLSRGVTCPASS